jgi:hypothetical protein
MPTALVPRLVSRENDSIFNYETNFVSKTCSNHHTNNINLRSFSVVFIVGDGDGDDAGGGGVGKG